MRSIKRIVLAAVVATMAFSMAGCKLIQKTPEAIQNTVLAKVGSEKITLGDVDAELKADIDYLKETYGDDFESKIDDELKAKLKEVRQQVLNALVEEKILHLEAEKKGLVPTQEELDKEVAERTAEIQETWGGEEAFAQAKEYYGYTDETFKAFLEDQVVIQKVKDEMFKDINITDDQINKYYEEHKDEFVNYGQADSRHLLFKTEEEAKAAGVDAFIAKPLFRSRLTATLRQFTSGRKENTARNYLEKLSEADYTGKRILLVEDNELNREIGVEILQMTGAEVETAENGKIAVEKVEASPEGLYDLVFMDIQMPVMNGYEATAAIRSLPGEKGKLPIVAMTANAFAEDVQLAKNTGMNGHIAKPLDMNKLNDVLENWL